MATSSSTEDEAKKIGGMFAVFKTQRKTVHTLVERYYSAMPKSMATFNALDHSVPETSQELPDKEGEERDQKHLESTIDAEMSEPFTKNAGSGALAHSAPQASGESSDKEGEESDENNTQSAVVAKMSDTPNQKPEPVSHSAPQASGESPDKEGEESDENNTQSAVVAKMSDTPNQKPEPVSHSAPQASGESSDKEGEESDENNTQSAVEAERSDTPNQKPEPGAHSAPQASGESPDKEGEESDENNTQSAVEAERSDTPNQKPEPVSHSAPQASGESSDKSGEKEGGKTFEASNDEPSKASFHLESSLEREVLLSHMRATIYGNCIGDAIGLLTEFMTKEEAKEIYGTVAEKTWLGFRESKKQVPINELELEYDMKHDDFHRSRWEIGDWTDDSDQMILILRTLLDHKGKADILDFVQKFKVWTQTGYKELGDFGGMGIGQTTFRVIVQREFFTDPHKCAYQVWNESGRWEALNGGVMRTSILGIQDFSDIPTVIQNTKQICKVTHADPRCIASCVAVTTAIALMLQGKYRKGDEYDEKAICKKAYTYACGELKTDKEKKELRNHMFAKELSDLKLSDDDKIGYTYKCLGAGFWAFRQKDFRLALTELVMEAGDADTNGAVAGALLGCKLGVEYLPETWLNGLKYKTWLDEQVDRYFTMLGVVERRKMELAPLRELETSLAAQRRAREETERRLHSSEQRSRELKTSFAALRQAKEETDRRLQNSQQRSRELDTALAAQRQAREETERRLHDSEQRSCELETTLATIQQEREESRRLREPCDWILDRNELHLSSKEIGRGAWGRVVEGTLGGCTVAVKEIHEQITSPYNRRLFEREMNIASKCRHPCLLQFIGATNDDESPLFVTELLETSLKAVLRKRPLEPSEITTIALDVAKGLNYLHLKRPTPIIHRDISSANVLLWKKGGNWRAKVSDYGAANFLQDAITVGPGALIYSAPEAHTSRQSPKVDVYSFGVLFCEMSIREQPDVSKRNQQIARVTNQFYRQLIRRCVGQNPEERPSMAEIIDEIQD